MNESFYSYIDQGLKGQDKDYFFKISNFIQQNDIVQITTIERKNSRPILYFLGESSQINTGTIKNNDIVLKLRGSNLDMFNLGERKLYEFEVHSFENFLNLYPLIKDLFFIEQRSVIEALASHADKNLKRISAKKELLRDRDLNQYFEEFSHVILENASNFHILSEEIQKNINEFYEGQFQFIDCYSALGDKKKKYIELSYLEENKNYISWDKEGSPGLIVDFLSNIFQFKFKENTYLKEIKNWNETLSNVGVPFIFYDNSKIPIAYNHRFSNLNLSIADCSDFRPSEIIEVDNVKFKVLKIQGINLSTLCIFSKIEYKKKQDSSNDELGIITSSIAHELNNPLGGILAGLDVLLLDDYTEEVNSELLAMKEGVARAQKLVRTFLGFSRNNSKEEVFTGNLNDSFIQAIELTRARLIESNLKLEYENSGLCPKDIVVPEAFMTMFFYLLVGEMITSIQRKNLVENIDDKKIIVYIHFEKEKFTFKCPNFEQTFERCSNSKLYSYLLSSLNLTSSLVQNEIIFKWYESET